MAFRLDRVEKQTRNQLIQDLRAKQDEFEALKSQGAPADDLRAKAAELLVLVGEAEEFRDGIATRFRDDFDDKSEKWQESENGEAAGELTDEWENESFDDFDLEDIEELELEDYAEKLENLREE